MVPVITGLYFGRLAGYRVGGTHNVTTSDTYALSVYTSSGVLWHQAGTTTKQLPLGGGNIVVHATK